MIDELLVPLLRGNRPGEPASSQWPALLEASDQNGVTALVARAALDAGWSSAFADAVRSRCAAETALALVRARELRRVLDALHVMGARPLLLKGAHLEWTHYPAPATRPRTDTDLLIHECDRVRVRSCLGTLGYEPLPHVTGEVAFTQFHFWRVDESGARHALDVHWRIANPKLVSDRIPYDDLQRTRVAVPQLGANAFAPASSDALQIACLHRSAHHRNSDRLIWLYDIHLLAQSLSAAEWTTMVDSTAARRLQDFVYAGLCAAAARFHTRVPHQHFERLGTAFSPGQSETDQFAPTRKPIEILVSDWRHIPRWSDRLRFLREHLVPSPSYMAQRYQTSNRASLPFLYVHRLVTGARRFF